MSTPLKQLLGILAKRLELDGLEQLETERSSAGHKLMTKNGSRDISPTLPKAKMELWLDGFLEGLDYRRHSK